MPSFDIVLEPDLVELRNAVEQCNKELATRFDFKGSDARVDSSGSGKGRELMLYADSDFQLNQVTDVLLGKLSKRGVDIRYLDREAKPEKLGGDKLRQKVVVKAGVSSETGKQVQQTLKAAKLKVQAAIQGDTVRVSGAKRDELQAAIALIRREVAELPLQFNNFRD